MRRRWFVILLLLAAPLRAAAGDADDPVLWPERQRAFLQDGPGWLLERAQREALLELDVEGRATFIREFLARDPLPDTETNELVEGIRRRQELVRSESLSPVDLRARLLFLHGRPLAKRAIECGETYRPIEIWTYPGAPEPVSLVLYREGSEFPFQLWLPYLGKAVLYTDPTAYILQQADELGLTDRALLFLRKACPESPLIDRATGVASLHRARKKRPSQSRIRAFLDPPSDLAAWARAAASTEVPERSELPVQSVELLFPAALGQRIACRLLVVLPADAGLEAFQESDKTDPELRLKVDGVVEQGGKVFEDFKMRFRLPPPTRKVPVALSVERLLRPGRSFVLRLRVEDEVSGRTAFVSRGFRVPTEAQEVTEPPVPDEVIVALGEELARRRVAGQDSLLLVPPLGDVVLGLWRAEALVTGSRIVKVVFLVDGKPQLSTTRLPFSAEIRLAKFPKEQVVRAEGYDEEGKLVAADEVVLNRPRGALRVRILEPKASRAVAGTVPARAEVVVPDGRRVESVEFLVDDTRVARLRKPPWETSIEVPGGGRMSYLTVVATLDDGSRAEDVVFLNSPEFAENVDVQLVELYTTVIGRSGRPLTGLQRSDFKVFEDGRPQKLGRFELVKDLPLHLGITIDTSGSMASSLPVARAAAVDFLHSILRPTDRVFAVGFAGEPILLVPPTDDVSAVEKALSELQSIGWTSLHDAVVTSLYYFRGIRGRKALILLSDGDDTASSISYRDALEYARRSGVVIYTVGLDVSRLDIKVRNKLNQLASETGGRSFYIKQAEELRGVYGEIEAELRSQYLLAYSSDRPVRDGSFRSVEVKCTKGKARTTSGYYAR